MYGSYNQASYYNGTNGHDTRYYQGNARNHKPRDDRKSQNSASSHQNNPSSSQQSELVNHTAGQKFYKYSFPAGTRTYNNSQHKRWPEKQFPNSPPAGKLRHGPPEPSPSQKPVDRVTNFRKQKSNFKQPVDDKANVEKEAISSNVNNNLVVSSNANKTLVVSSNANKTLVVSSNANKTLVVSRSSAAAPQKNSADNKSHTNRQGGRKQNPGRPLYFSAGSNKTKNKKDQYNSKQLWEYANCINSYYSVFPQYMLPPDSCNGSRHRASFISTTPMLRCLTRSSAMVVTDPPDNLTNGSCWDKLSEAMWNKFDMNQQCEEIFRIKIRLWEFLYMHIRGHYPRYGLYLVGSSLNGFAMDSSDMDLCLMIHHMEIDQRTDAQLYLNSILGILSNFTFIQELKLIHAKVPLVKFKDGSSGLNVDLNCNNSVGIRNTHLLQGYSQLDWRVKPLVLLVKMWAKCHDINDAKSMTLSSYSLSLMVLHFLQCGVRPAILPCLQKLYPEKYSTNRYIGMIHILEELPPHKTDNNQTLGELFLQFFQYYTHFDFAEDAISVRLACTIPVETCRYAKSLKNDPMQWKYINIEEPFDLTNTARSVHEPSNYQRIIDVFTRSASILEESLTLNSVLTPIR